MLLLGGCTSIPATSEQTAKTPEGTPTSVAATPETTETAGTVESGTPEHVGLLPEERGEIVAFVDGQSGSRNVATLTPNKEVLTVRISCSGHGEITARVAGANGDVSSSEFTCRDREERAYYDTGYQLGSQTEVTISVEGEAGLLWAATVIERTAEEAGIPELTHEESPVEESELSFEQLLEELELSAEEFEEYFAEEQLTS